MTIASILSLVAVFGVLFFFAGRRCGSWVCLVVLAAGFLTAGWFGDRILKNTPQKTFASLPLPVETQAMILNALGPAGIGGLAGLSLRGALALAGRRGGSRAE